MFYWGIVFCGEKVLRRRIELDAESRALDTEGVLEACFRYGQNEFQPCVGVPSLSVGDVIVLHDAGVRRWFLIEPIGFRELTAGEFDAYHDLDEYDRWKFAREGVLSE